MRGLRNRLSNQSFGMKRRELFGFPKRSVSLAFGGGGIIRGARRFPINIFRKRGQDSFIAKKKVRMIW